MRLSTAFSFLLTATISTTALLAGCGESLSCHGDSQGTGIYVSSKNPPHLSTDLKIVMTGPSGEDSADLGKDSPTGLEYKGKDLPTSVCITATAGDPSWEITLGGTGSRPPIVIKIDQIGTPVCLTPDQIMNVFYYHPSSCKWGTRV